ncbi:Outer membrane beta-barrel assembly protein BamD [hydrothermal vent metagenome]|uniref:Outer membrane beta-barrel assembly protein BamD n=1 Tax=hydrothermal vent metagenome TaxID=652676 RepID=A0A3B0W1R7_9ZZZZ
MKKTLLSALIIATLSLQGCSSLTSLVAKEDSEKTAEDFYSSATAAFKASMWDTAIKEYEKLKSFYPYGDYTEQSYTELAYAYYRYNEPESAIRELDEFMRLFPKHPNIDYALYLKALSIDSINKSWLDKLATDPADRDTKSAQRAAQYYTDLVKRFPNSRYTAEASRRLVVLNNQMARHELLVAQFYFDRQAYLAAANRATYILKNYPQTVITLDTLTLLEQAYQKLEMPEVAQDVQQVIALNKTRLQPSMEAAKQKQLENQQKNWWGKTTDFFDGFAQ